LSIPDQDSEIKPITIMSSQPQKYEESEELYEFVVGCDPGCVWVVSVCVSRDLHHGRVVGRPLRKCLMVENTEVKKLKSVLKPP